MDGEGTGANTPKDGATEKINQPPKRVRVLVNNLGPNLYQAGQVTEDPDICALYGDGTNRVGPVTVR